MRLLFFSMHGGDAQSMALLCQGSRVAIDIAGTKNRIVSARTTPAEQTALRKLGAGSPDDEEIEDRFASASYDAVVVSTPEQVDEFRQRLSPVNRAVPIVVHHTINRFNDFQRRGIRNFLSPSPRALSEMACENRFLTRRLLWFSELPEPQVADVSRAGFASYIHNYQAYWPEQWQRYRQLNEMLAPYEVINYGANSEHGTVNDVLMMMQKRATVHLKGRGIWCFAVLRSMAMGTPTLVDKETAERCYLDGLEGILVKPHVADLAEELRRFSTDDAYWAATSQSTFRLARKQFCCDEDLAERFRRFIERSKTNLCRPVRSTLVVQTGPANLQGSRQGTGRIDRLNERAMNGIFRAHRVVERQLDSLTHRIREMHQRPPINLRLHQVLLGNKAVEPRWYEWMEAWRILNPGYRYQLWTDKECDALVERHAPAFWDTWQAIPPDRWVIKTDYVRLLIVQVFGGFYFDCDVEPLEPIDAIGLNQSACVLFLEEPGLVTNAGFGARRGHPLLRRAIGDVSRNIRERILGEVSIRRGQVVELTGPVRLHLTAAECGADFHATTGFTREDFVSGRHVNAARNDILVCPQEALCEKPPRAFFAVHWFYGSWCSDLDQPPAESDQTRTDSPLTHAVKELLEGRDQVFFLKLGAHDGVSWDAVYPLIMRYPHWRGVCVEPVPHVFEHLKANYADPARFRLINVAIASRSGKQPFYYVSPDAKKSLPDLPHWSDGLGSLDPSHIPQHLGESFAPYIVAEELDCLTLRDLYDQYDIGTVDLVDMDVEGSEHEIIKQLDLEQQRPGCIVFEHKHLSRKQAEFVNQRLVGHGYSLRRFGDDTLAQLASSPSSVRVVQPCDEQGNGSGDGVVAR